ncbi:bacteriophage holin [Natrialbaceae archaeon A-arb3/5]
MQSQNRPRDPEPTIESADERRERLDPLAFGFAIGTTMAASVGLIGVTSRLGWGQRWRTLFADMYPGFEEDEGGTLVGIAWGGLDGFVAGVMVGWLYNVFRRKSTTA